MVESQIISRGIRDKRVIEEFLAIDRKYFVPPDKMLLAYQDSPLPIGDGQTISQPYMVAEMTELLELSGEERVLEIGTGSGYQTALLSLLAKEVYTVEIIPRLSLLAREKLEALGIKNVHYKIGDGYEGWKEFAPYDAIIVTAAPEIIPATLEDQLAEGGRMVIPVGRRYSLQTLYRLKKKKGKIYTEKMGTVAFVPMVKG